jgi:hypothetical protein
MFQTLSRRPQNSFFKNLVLSPQNKQTISSLAEHLGSKTSEVVWLAPALLALITSYMKRSFATLYPLALSPAVASETANSDYDPMTTSNVGCFKESQVLSFLSCGSRKVRFPERPKSVAISNMSCTCMKWAHVSAQSFRDAPSPRWPLTRGQ